MKPRSFVLCAALVITTGACSSDARSSERMTNGTTRTPATTAAPATTGAAATTVSAETTSAAGTTATAGAPLQPAADTAVPDPVPPQNPGGTTADTTVQQPDPQLDQQSPQTNPVTNPADDALSTFAMDVDTGSYTYTRGALSSGVIPDPGVVRTEEFITAHEQGYAQPLDGETFALTIDATTAPFLASDVRILRVGVQGESVADENRPDANLTFVVDISGSMADPGKLDAVRPALSALVETLRPTDRVGIVVYSDDTRVLLETTPVSERLAISEAIAQLQPEGSTNVEQGLRLGYDEARSSLDPERIDRVILLSDGVANVGETGPEAILDVIGDASRDGIDLVTVGFGLGDYNDTLMEQLADRGDGFYAYVDGEGEAVRLFGEDLTGTLQTIAREAKVQVEFNPARVEAYRLVGFENRAVADEDFRDDTVDGGEVGAGHTVTALYEVTLHEGAAQQVVDAGTAPEQDAVAPDNSWLARGVIRWQDPDTAAANELDATLLATDADGDIGDAALRFQQDVYVAVFAETLRGSGWDGLMSLDGVSENLHSLALRLDDDAVAGTADLVDARIALG